MLAEKKKRFSASKRKSNFKKKQTKEFNESKREICCEKKIKEGVNVLKVLNKKFVEQDLKKTPLLENIAESYVHLQVTLKKIPPPRLVRMIRVPLPHSLLTETSEVCLITGDLDKRNHKAEVEPTIMHYKDLLRKQGVTNVSQVIPIRQLRTEYKTFESRRQLAAAYDVFLVDKKIAGIMGKTLGKSFFQSRKFPIQIDMKRPNLKDQIDKALCQTEFSLTCRGNSHALEVARLSMEDEAIVENIKTCIEVLEKRLPGSRENILGLYLKTAKSKAIPIYVSFDIPDKVSIEKDRRNQSYELDELSTVDNAEVKVFQDGRVIVRKMEKESGSCEDAAQDNLMEIEENIQESNEVEITNNTEMEDEESTEDSAKALKKKKRKPSDAVEIANNAEIENEENTEDSAKTLRKKKKKNKRSIDLVEKEDNQNFTTNVVSPKKKKKYANLDETTDIVEIGSKQVQNSVSAEIPPKKKKKGKKVF